VRDIGGILYCNDGDWVESLSALVEESSGALRLVTWQEIMQRKTHWSVESTEQINQLDREPACVSPL
jgi:hypothetical protein